MHEMFSSDWGVEVQATPAISGLSCVDLKEASLTTYCPVVAATLVKDEHVPFIKIDEETFGKDRWYSGTDFYSVDVNPDRK
jgi:hypothetical protein